MTDRNDPGRRRTYAATAGDAGQRLDRVLAEALDGVSRARVKALIEAGHITRRDGVHGAATITEPSSRVKPGQTFAIFLPQPRPAVPVAQALPLEIVYEDEDMIVIDKQAGLVVHPAPGNPDGTLVNALIAHCGDGLTGIGGVMRPGIVHRLDKDTSGLMVAAKTQAAHEGLSAQFAARSVGRVYCAVVWGVPVPAQGEIAGNIGRSPRNRKKMAVLKQGGKKALTRYEVAKNLGPGHPGSASVVDCRLATGRTHQVRVHMAAISHPLIGDPLYGRGPGGAGRGGGASHLPPLARHFPRQALHARALAFRHPRTAQSVEFSSPLPQDMRELIYCFESF